MVSNLVIEKKPTQILFSGLPIIHVTYNLAIKFLVLDKLVKVLNN